MNSCKRLDDVLRYKLDEMSERETAEFEAHLKVCPFCREEIRIERLLEGRLAVLYSPNGLEYQVLSRIKEIDRKIPIWSSFLPVITALLIATGVITVFLRMVLPGLFSGFDTDIAVTILQSLVRLIFSDHSGIIFIVGGLLLTGLATVFAVAFADK